MMDVSKAWIIVGVIFVGFAIVSIIRNKSENVGKMVVWFASTMTGWVLFSAVIIDLLFNSSLMSCLSVGGLHPNAQPPYQNVYDLNVQFQMISNPCTLSGKLLPWAMIGLAILSCLVVMKGKPDSQ